ncbi:Ig-like domain-containing protein [Vacuolonema iberomarrocanum]|uniref:Ig-like domain-containing protein n=1 Tax=Vacuolonema iberomarrocanum TaxID=3454632 RepID=UPI003F6DEDF9
MARFNVSNIAPTANDIDAGANSPVVITFDETINPSTINDTSIKIFGSQTGEIAGSFSVSGNRVTFTPTSAYKPGEQIEVVVTDTVRSVGGNTATAYTAKFTIAAATGPAEFIAHPTQPPGTDSSNDVSLGDLDGDGDLDAFVANNFQANQVLFNNGSGVFTAAATQLPNTVNDFGVSLGDLDGDGDLDAFVAKVIRANQVLLNDGSGVFTAAATQPPGRDRSYGVSLGDLDGDGDLDAFVANDGRANQVLLNDGSGVFTAAATQPPGSDDSYGVSLGDVDGDGDLDAFVANFGQASQVLLNDGSGVFTAVTTQPPGTGNSLDVSLGDLDGDGDLDAFVANFTNQANQVLLNNGSGVFTVAAVQPSGRAKSRAVELGDLDGDGDLDAFVTNDGQTNQLLLNDGNGVFTDATTQPPGATRSRGVGLGDLDGDGDLDAFVANNGQTNQVLINGDRFAPTLTRIARETPSAAITNADSLIFRVTFDEDVQNVNAADFTVDGTTTATVSGVNAVSASVYDVTVSGGDLASFDGTVGLDLAVSQDIQDLAGNDLPAGDPGTDETYTLDNSSAIVSISSTTADGTVGIDDTVNATVTFSETVTLAGGNLTLTLDNGGSVTITPFANSTTASGTYTVVAGQDSADLDVTGLTLAGGATLQDGLGNDVTLTIPPGASLADNNDIVVDTTVPALDSITRETPSDATTNADSLTFRVTFDEDVQNVDTDDFAIDGTTTATVSGVSQVSASVYEVTVSGGDLADFDGTVGLNLAGAQNITDLVGNGLPAGEPTTDDIYTLDNTQPGDIVVNEILQNPSAVSDADGEWFELYNPTANDIDINGWTIADDGSDSHTIANGAPLIIAAGGYLILGRNADAGSNGGVAVDYEYSSYLLANGDDEIILTNTVGVEIDRVEYDGGPNFPDPDGASMSLLDPTLDNNVGANWATSNTAYGDGDFGTPGAVNVFLPTVRLAASDTNAAESPADTAAFTLSRDDTDGALTVVVDLGGDAIDSDYSFSTGTVMGNQLSLVIPDGQASVVVTVTAVDDGLVEANETLTVGLANDAAYVVDSTDNASNITLVSDDTSPVVTSITRVGDPRTNAANVDYLVTFNRVVSGVDATDFALTVTGITGASVTNATTTDDITYTVTVNTGTGDGTLRLDLSDNNSITDNDTNPLGGSGLNDGDFTTGESYTIDKTAPANPFVNSLTDDTAADDNITRDTTLVFAGTAEAESSVELFLDGNSIGTVTATGGTWSFDYTGTTLTDGDYILTARATDTAGNTSDASADFAFTVDATAPDAASIDSLSEDSGAADNITNDQGLEFSGSAEAGSVVELFLDGNSIGTAMATGGIWSFDYTGTELADGDYILTARSTDTAGNTSDASANFAFTVDITAPDAPSIDSLSEDSGAADDLTNDQGLEFSGSAEAGSVVELFLDGNSIGTVTATGGTWSFDYTGTELTDGDYVLTARAADIAGNTSNVSANFEFTIDTTAPDAPIINSLSEDSGAADNITNDQGLEFSGTAEADSVIELFLDSASIGTTTATAGGAWNFDYTGTELTDGDYILTARATDTASNTSDASADFEFTVDASAPDAPNIDSLSEDSGAADNLTNDQCLEFSGTAEADSVVELFLDNASIGTTTATAGGTWSFDYTGTELTDGDYILTARVTDIAGNTSDASANFAFTVDTTAPDAPSINSLSEDSGVADNLTNDQGLEFSGTAEADSVVELFLDGASIGTTTATAGGNWSFDYTGTALTDGDYILTATATDVAGNASDVSANFEFTVDTTAPDAPAIANLSDDTAAIDNITGDTTLVFTGTAEADSTVELFLNGTAIGTAIATGGNWSFDHTGTTLADGDYTLTAMATDVAGNVSLVSAGFDFTIDATAPMVTGIVPSVETIQDANVGSDGFTLTVSFSEAMDTTVDPTLSFPTSEEDPSRVLTFNSGTWTDATTYVASYDVTDANENIPNIDVQVADAQDIAGNVISSPVQADRFSIGLISSVEFSDTRYTVSEDGGTSDVVTLTRSGDLSGITTVQVTLDGGTATGNGTDYIDTDFPLTVTFAATETTKTVALPILDDELVEGDETLALSVISVSNAAIASQSTATIAITDNDTAGFTLSKATATVGEDGSTDTFVITLDAAPLTLVEFAISSDDTGEVAGSPATVSLDESNWNTGATVTLTGQDDTDVDGNQTTTVSVQVVAAQSDAAFAGLSAQTVQVTTTDDDASGFTPFDDDFTGTDAQDVEFALAGDDTLRGRGGNDRLAGQVGNDNLLGGNGNDSLIGSNGTDTATGGSGNDRMLGGRGRDRLVGNAGNDYLVGGSGVDILLGGAGDDTLIGGVDNDRLLGGSGNDRMRGNLGNDQLNGGVGNDVMLGGNGNDTLNGQGGNDRIRGGAGRDVIRGGLGNDRLSGELGNDRITTGNGRDRITIRRGHGFDRVTDFQNGQDRIVLGGLRFSDLTIRQQGRDVLIRSGSERLLLLQNTRIGQINAADFV